MPVSVFDPTRDARCTRCGLSWWRPGGSVTPDPAQFVCQICREHQEARMAKKADVKEDVKGEETPKDIVKTLPTEPGSVVPGNVVVG